MRRFPTGCGVVLALILAGCSPSPQVADEPLNALLVERGRVGPSGEGEAFDFGPVLVRGQSLDHVFSLKNPRDRPLRIVGAEAQTPCCSSIDPLPEAIPAGGEAPVSVHFRPGGRIGRQRVAFHVETDAADAPVRTYAVLATLYPEVEVLPEGDAAVRLPLERTGELTLRVLVRHPRDGGPGLPERIDTADGVTARFGDTLVEETLADGLVESARTIEVTLPASSRAGARTSEITLRREGGESFRHLLSWSVEEAIRAAPSGLVLKAGDGPATRKILLRSTDRPFRITGLTGELLAPDSECPSEPADSRHVVPMSLDPTDRQGSFDVRIATDHPDQPEVVVSVLVLPGPGGARP